MPQERKKRERTDTVGAFNVKLKKEVKTKTKKKTKKKKKIKFEKEYRPMVNTKTKKKKKIKVEKDLLPMNIVVLRCRPDATWPVLQVDTDWNGEIAWGRYLIGKELVFYYPPAVVARPVYHQPVIGLHVKDDPIQLLIGNRIYPNTVICYHVYLSPILIYIGVVSRSPASNGRPSNVVTSSISIHSFKICILLYIHN